jgi:biopolymer transport protein ExbB
LTVLSGAALFVGACLVVSLARRPAVIAAYALFLLLPLLLGALGALKGCVSSFSVLAMSGTQIKQSQIFGGLAETLVLLFTALTVTLPSYLVIAVGLFVRTLAADGRTTHGRKA